MKSDTFQATAVTYILNNIHEMITTFLLLFFIIWVLRPFQEYFTYIEPFVHQRWAKIGENLGKDHLTIRKQNLDIPDVTRARLEPQR